MIAPVVTGAPIVSPVLLLGQAPGAKEGPLGRPFAWTAGKTLFQWLGTLGIDEAGVRGHAYMAAVCRCFPGKQPKGGDRVPAPLEIETCAVHLRHEVKLLRPRLVVPIGKLAISQLVHVEQLADVIGTHRRVTWHGHAVDVVPLPHPSGASTWHRTEPGKTLLARALRLLGQHEAFRAIVAAAAAGLPTTTSLPRKARP